MDGAQGGGRFAGFKNADLHGKPLGICDLRRQM